MNLGDKVRQRRLELNMTQDELAKRMGYSSRVSINKIENGRDVSQKIIVRLADVLDVTPTYLMGWEEDEPQLSVGVTNSYEQLKSSFEYIEKRVNEMSDEQKVSLIKDLDTIKDTIYKSLLDKKDK